MSLLEYLEYNEREIKFLVENIETIRELVENADKAPKLCQQYVDCGELSCQVVRCRLCSKSFRVCEIHHEKAYNQYSRGHLCNDCI